jgi:hypothetical protein
MSIKSANGGYLVTYEPNILRKECNIIQFKIKTEEYEFKAQLDNRTLDKISKRRTELNLVEKNNKIKTKEYMD